MAAGLSIPVSRAYSSSNRAVQFLAAAVLLYAYGVTALAFVVGGDLMLIVLGLTLAATSMELFRLARAETEE